MTEELKEEEVEEVEAVEAEEATEETQDDLADILKESYEQKIAAITMAYEQRLAERDRVIKELINNKNTQEAEKPTLIDKINAHIEAQLRY